MRATHFYSRRDDGLKRPWAGRVWLNPPFGKFGPFFVRRVVAEIEEGNISQAILLVKATHLATGWFTDALPMKHLLCFPPEGINFNSSIAPRQLYRAAQHPSARTAQRVSTRGGQARGRRRRRRGPARRLLGVARGRARLMVQGQSWAIHPACEASAQGEGWQQWRRTRKARRGAICDGKTFPRHALRQRRNPDASPPSRRLL